jgi:branched-chain amino acid transport system ATP-binding protein
MGLLPARRGSSKLDGRRVDHLPAFRVTRLGLGLVPEGRQIFPNLTVRENLVAAAANRLGRAAPWTLERVFALFRAPANASATAAASSRAAAAVRRRPGALMTNPRLLILDRRPRASPADPPGDQACLAQLKAKARRSC